MATNSDNIVNTEISMSSADSHQAQSNCIIKFVRFVDKDTYYKSDSTNSTVANRRRQYNPIESRRLVVTNDIISATVASSKANSLLTAEVVLASGDKNYMSMLSPNDHCFIWMVNDANKYYDLFKRVDAGSKANEFDSGLKFIGRVNSVRAVYNTSPNGIKTLRYVVTLKGFSELQSSVYYNPNSYAPSDRIAPSANETPESAQERSQRQFLARISETFNSYLTSAGIKGLSPNELLPFFITLFLGEGPKNNNSKMTGSTLDSPNEAFLIPPQVAETLGVTNNSSKKVRYCDILKCFIGVQKYDQSNIFPANLKDPQNFSTINLCKNPLYGAYATLPQGFHGETIWQLLQAHLNSSMNELYCSIRPGSGNGDIFPVIVARQIPFTSKKYSKKNSNKKTVSFTEFSSLPAWKVDSSYPINSFNFGTSDSLRFNFIQVYGAKMLYNTDAAKNIVDFNRNYTIDTEDIKRNGLKLQIMETTLDFIQQRENPYDLSMFATIIGDFWHNGHLKMNGSISMPGVQKPICVGDNLKYDGKLFHIEGVVHSYSVADDGSKFFITDLQLSNGVLDDGEDNYITLQPYNRDELDDEAQPGFTDEQIKMPTNDEESK